MERSHTTNCKNASKKLNILAKIKTLVDRKTLTTMYTAFFRPSLEYGSILFCNCTDTENELLESVQRRAFRIITGGIIRTHTINLYNEVGLETLKIRRERNVLLFFFKIIHYLVPSYLLELKPDKKPQGRYPLRNTCDYTPPKWRLVKMTYYIFLPFAIQLWNNLDEKTQGFSNYSSFQDSLQTKLTDNQLFHTGNRQEQILMAKIRMRCSSLNGHLSALNVIESSACSCGFANEDEFHFFFVCPLYNRPRTTLLNIVSRLAPTNITLRTLLYGAEELDFTENRKIILGTLTFVKVTKRFE